MPSVLLIDRSAVGESVSVSVSELFAGVGSVVPDGTVMVPVFVSEPVAVADSVAVSVNVAVPPTSNDTGVLMLPDPDAAQVEPADAVHSQVAPVSAAGKVSVTVALTTVDGPAFEATMV